MNFIGRHLSLIGILLLTVFVGAAAGLYFDGPGRLQSLRAASNAKQTYTCPMHPDGASAKPATYPKCGMALMPASLAGTVAAKSAHDECGDSGQNHPGCCADKSTSESATELRLPPGPLPVPGGTTEPTPNGEPASANTTAYSSH